MVPKQFIPGRDQYVKVAVSGFIGNKYGVRDKMLPLIRKKIVCLFIDWGLQVNILYHHGSFSFKGFNQFTSSDKVYTDWHCLIIITDPEFDDRVIPGSQRFTHKGLFIVFPRHIEIIQSGP